MILTISIGRERIGRHGRLWSMVWSAAAAAAAASASASASLWLWLWLRREQQAPVVAGQTKTIKCIPLACSS